MAEASLKLGGSWATKEGSLLGFNDQNGNYKPIPFDFTRATAATRVNRDGLIEEVQEGVPRIDFTGDGSLLLEPQRTNLITYSEDFSEWSNLNNAVVTDNFIASPDGTQNAAKIVYDGTTSGRIEISTTASGTNTQSVYLKTASGTQNVSIGASSGDLTEVTVTSDWQRFTHTGSGSFPRILCDDAATIYVWGAQLEAGSYATSYIKTSGSTVTRNADVCNNAETTFNDSEGVLYMEIAALSDDGTNRQTSINDNSTSDRIMINLHATSNQIQAYIVSGFVEQADMRHTVSNATAFNKIAVKYKLNDCALWVNGVEVATDTSATMPSGLQKFNFDNGAGSADFFGNCKEIRVYNTALTDTQLQELTTI